MGFDQNDRYLHPIGLVGLNRDKRLAYDAMKALFSGQKTIALQIGTHKSSFPIAHIISGFLVIFVIAYFYHYNRRYNETFKRALSRSRNFFSDLRDVRTVSPLHTLITAASIALTMAVVLSGLLYHFRKSFIADYVITQFCFSDGVKERLIHAAWHPFEGIAIFGTLFLILSVLLTLIIKVLSRISSTKIFFSQAFTAIVWGALPLVFLSPVGMSLIKVISNPAYVLPLLTLVFAMLLWTAVRILKGISVIFDVRPFKLYAVVLFAGSLLVVSVFFYLDAHFAVGANYELLIHVLRELS